MCCIFSPPSFGPSPLFPRRHNSIQWVKWGERRRREEEGGGLAQMRSASSQREEIANFNSNFVISVDNLSTNSKIRFSKTKLL